MNDHLGNSYPDGNMNQLATKPRKPAAPAKSMGARLALIALLVIALGVLGLIAEAVSGDGKSPLSGFLRNANSTFTTVGGRISASHKEEFASRNDPLSVPEDDGIQYGPDIVVAKNREMSKDGRRGADKTATPQPTPTSSRTPFAERTMTMPEPRYDRDKGSYAKTESAPPKKDGYFTPKETPSEQTPPRKDPVGDPQSPVKIDDPKFKAIIDAGQEPPDPNRKIIRTGEMDFEIDSYDVAIVNITRLIIQVKGAFVSDSKSGQLKNGKLHGYVVVRMPPQFLDQFLLDLRRDLGKIGELKTQRINSQDVTKQFTDTESALKAARTMEERFLSIIKTGKGEIKDLIAAENALGEWRTKIEKMEGEIRYYNNQVGLSTLTISLSERELQTPFALVATETVRMRIEAEDVKKAHQAAEKAVIDAKGRVLRSEVKQHAAGQLEAVLHADLPPAARDAFGALVEKLGIVAHQESHRQQEARGGTGKPTESIKAKEHDVHFEVTFNNLVNVAPRNSTTLQLASLDVADSYHKLHAAIAQAKGQVRNTHLNESDKKNISASIDFSVPTAEKPALDRAIADAGQFLTRNNAQTPITELASERKFGYNITLVSVTNIQPREKTQLRIEGKDVDQDAAKLKKLAEDARGRVVDARTQRKPNGEVAAILVFDVPYAAKDSVVRQFKEVGKLIGQEEERYQGAPENELAVARIHVVLANEGLIVPSDEGFGASVRFSLYLSFKIFVTCVMFIVVGVSAVLPWGLLIWIGYKLYCRFSPPAAAPAAALAVQPAAPANPPNAEGERAAPKV